MSKRRDKKAETKPAQVVENKEQEIVIPKDIPGAPSTPADMVDESVKTDDEILDEQINEFTGDETELALEQEIIEENK